MHCSAHDGFSRTPTLIRHLKYKRAICINTHQVIGALVEEKGHVPYMESKLTMLLKSAFGGSSRTFAVVTVRPEEEFGDETVHALRFGEVMKRLMLSKCLSAYSVDLRERACM